MSASTKNHTKITNESIESAGLPKDHKNAIAEYIWNGFDARASKVSIEYNNNELGFINSIRITDNGEGIPYDTLDQSFGNFLDSLKKTTLKRSSYIRGKKGKGRFAFSLFATRANWHTQFNQNNKVFQYKILIDRHSKESYEVSTPVDSQSAKTGTSVLLEGIFDLNAAYLTSDEFNEFMAREFGWFLLLNKDQGYDISINGKSVVYDYLIQEQDTTDWTIYSPDENSYAFKVNYVRWNENIGDRYYYYFLNSDKKEVAKELTSFNNNAIDFHHSVYIESTFFNTFAQEDIEVSRDTNLFNERSQSQVFRQLLAELRDLLERKQKKYVREQAAKKMLSQIDSKGLLPTYTNEPHDRFRKATVLAVINEIYTIDPKIFVGMRPDHIKSYIGFIDLLLQTDKKTEILEVLETVIDFKKEDKLKLHNILNSK